MKIDDTGFNSEWVKKKSEEQFLKEFEGVSDILPLEEGEKAADRVGRLKAAYKRIMSGPVKEETKPAKVFQPMMPTEEEKIPVSVVPNPA